MKSTERKAHIYCGVVILPADRNSSGIRWTANVGTGITLRADTLQGIRELIREAKNNKPTAEVR